MTADSNGFRLVNYSSGFLFDSNNINSTSKIQHTNNVSKPYTHSTMKQRGRTKERKNTQKMKPLKHTK